MLNLRAWQQILFFFWPVFQLRCDFKLVDSEHTLLKITLKRNHDIQPNR